MPQIKEGDNVQWKWGEGYAEGTVKSTFAETTTRTIDGKEIKRKGSSDNKALYIEVEGANNVLKLESEVEKK